MADQAFTDRSSSDRRSTKSGARADKSVADELRSAGKEMRNKASDFADSSTETIKQHASDLADAAEQVKSQAADRFKEMVDSQKEAGARYVGGLAEAVRRAAREFDGELPVAGDLLRKAASQVDAVSESVRKGDFSDFLGEAKDFARRQPTAFLSLTALAGFGIVRFLKSSSQHTHGAGLSSAEISRDEEGSTYEGSTY